MFFLGKDTMTKRSTHRTGSWRHPLSWKAQGSPTHPAGHAHEGHASSALKTNPDAPGNGSLHHEAERPKPSVDIKSRIGTASFAFRGYDVTNLGRTPELLAHKAYGPVVRSYLDLASKVASDTLHRAFDLSARVEAREESTLKGFADDVALIVAVELAQLACLEQFFGVEVKSARQTFGYSIGEMASMVAGGVFTMEELLPVPLLCADDCAELAEDAHLGIIFSRGPVLTAKEIQALCTTVSADGKGIVGPSSYLSPNTALVMGQGDTLDRLEKAIPSFYPEKVMLRRKTTKLPPLHTPLVWLRNIPNRAAVALYSIPGGLKTPTPRVVSCVTGAASYDSLNARDLLIRWVDQPQLLWDAICETLSSGVDLVVHAGPAPNLIPATFERLSNNVTKQLGNRYFQMIGRGVGSQMHRHAWLGRILPSKAALLLAPHVTHVVLEDWLLEHEVA
jgi:[acyl-carrier-protein] S-malonyltransferase